MVHVTFAGQIPPSWKPWDFLEELSKVVHTLRSLEN